VNKLLTQLLSPFRLSAAGQATENSHRELAYGGRGDGVNVFLASIVESSDDAIFGMTLDGTLVTWNQGASSIYGFSPQEVIGRSVSMFAPPDRRHEAAGILKRIAQGERISHFETIRLRKDGTPFDVSLTVSPLMDSSGEVTGAATIARDLSERKRAEDRLRLMQFSIDHASEFVTWVDSQGRILYANDALCGSLGRSREELLSMSIWDIDPDLTAQRWQATWQQLKDLGSLVFESHKQTKLGRVFPVEVAASYLKFGEKEYGFAFSRDITEHKRAWEVLQESEARLRALVEAIDDVVFELDAEGAYINVWAGDKAILVRPKGELIGRKMTEVLGGDFAPMVEVFKRVLASGRSEEVEYTLDLPGGKRCFLARISPIRSADGSSKRVCVLVRDTTERKQAEEALRLMQFSVEHASDAVFWMNPQGRIVYANEAACRSLERSREELLSLSISDIDPDFHPEPWDAGWQEFKSGGSMTFETRHRSKQGRVFPVEVSAKYLEFGGKEYVITSARDITQRRRAEDALRDSEHWLRESQRISQIGTYVLDVTSGIFSTVSQTLEDILGIGPEYPKTVEGWKGLVHPEQREELMEHFTHEVLERRKPFDLEYRVVRPSDGQVRWVHGRGAAICDSSGQLTTMAGTLQDISARKAVEEQLQQAQKLESLGRLAGGVAHDFNNLLTIINGYSALLLRDVKEGDPLREDVSEIHKAGEQAARLTQQLLSFGTKQVVRPEPIDLTQFISDNMGMLQRLVGEDIQLEIQLAPSLGIVLADPGQLHQVLMNLAVNARDAMPRGGRITIKTAHADVDGGNSARHPIVTPGRYVLWSVTDTGCGMGAEVQKHIFDPFFTTKAKGQGTGLGLATVYGIIRQAGGSITVESDVGQGTTFLIYLPLSEAPLPTCQRTAPPSLVLGGKETVLLVEDREPVRKLAAGILRRYGYRILEAAHGEEALQMADGYSEPIHLLLTDVIMPGMTGPELAQRLNTRRPSLRVMYTSGYAADIVTSRGLLDPGQLHITKPFTPDELATKVREALRRVEPATTGRLLVVDDESQARTFFHKVLKEAGYDVQLAENGNQALKAVRARPFDLVLTDLTMPDGEGIETIQVICKEQPNLKIIAVSGYRDGEFLIAARLLGANVTLAKPVDPVTLVSAVRETLSQPESLMKEDIS